MQFNWPSFLRVKFRKVVFALVAPSVADRCVRWCLYIHLAVAVPSARFTCKVEGVTLFSGRIISSATIVGCKIRRRCQLRTRRNGPGRSSAWNARGGVGIIDAYDVLSQVYYWAEPTYASMWNEPLGVGAWKIKITGLLKAAADGSQFVGAVEGSPSAWASAGLLWAPLTTTY